MSLLLLYYCHYFSLFLQFLLALAHQPHQLPVNHMDSDTRHSLIYAVDLAVDKQHKEGYLAFLDSFVEGVLQLEGFQRAQVLVRSCCTVKSVRSIVIDSTNPTNQYTQVFTQLDYLQEANDDKIHLSVHYTIANEAALQAFITQHRAKVLEAGTEFQYQVLKRQVLKPNFVKYPQVSSSGIMFSQ
jgi:hypothetical protein